MNKEKKIKRIKELAKTLCSGQDEYNKLAEEIDYDRRIQLKFADSNRDEHLYDEFYHDYEGDKENDEQIEADFQKWLKTENVMTHDEYMNEHSYQLAWFPSTC